jgi:hypothetical protein
MCGWYMERGFLEKRADNDKPEEQEMASMCNVAGCDKLAQHGKDGLCCKHFTASKKTLKPLPVKPVAKKRGCKVDHCTKQAQIEGLCKRHYGIAVAEAGNPSAGVTVIPVVAEAPAAVNPSSAPVIALTPAQEVADEEIDCMAIELSVLQQRKRDEWLEDLRGATTLRSRSKLFLAMCEATEAMVY